MAMLFGCSPNSDPHATPSVQAKRVPIERSNSNTHSRAPAETASISVSIPSSADVSVEADAAADVSMDGISVEDARSPHSDKVFLRQRPSSPQLARAIHIPSKASTKSKSVSFRPVSFNSTQSDAEAVYNFDHVFQETADNEEVFRTTTLPLLVHLFDEPTPTDELILAYGPSGSAKTHTLSAILNKSIAFLVNRVISLSDCVNKMVKNQKSQSAFEREKKRVKLEKIPYNSCQLTKSLQPLFRTARHVPTVQPEPETKTWRRRVQIRCAKQWRR
ncbi:hypothetical protein BJ741DRAFT_275824 [Chytriomyces cf. hyalinus JEL632]|nr:hypothetical protein BJ741DRAFT_275824 [Chytriomyces cf. hyalinus JEL632]